MHQGYYVVVKQEGATDPKPAQRLGKKPFVHWAAKLVRSGASVYGFYEACGFGFACSGNSSSGHLLAGRSNCPAPVFNHLLKCLVVQAALRRAVLAGKFQILAEPVTATASHSQRNLLSHDARIACPLARRENSIQTFSLSRIALNEQESAPTIPKPKQS